MFSDSAIPKDLIKAYLETEYRVLGEVPFIIRVGRVSSHLLEAHKRYQVTCSAFVTAWNPYSQQVDDAKNRVLQAALCQELTNRELHFVAGIGQHPSGQWAGEESYLIFGLDLKAAKALGATLEQNAIVWSGPDGTPQLILLK